jgi:hypothetical protein
VHKKGDREYIYAFFNGTLPQKIENTRSKVLERCVFCNIKDHLFYLVRKSQRGFISGKSCVTNLLDVLHYIGSELDAGGQIEAVYLDMSKAFDKVNHERLTHKLSMAGFGGRLLQ